VALSYISTTHVKLSNEKNPVLPQVKYKRTSSPATRNVQTKFTALPQVTCKRTSQPCVSSLVPVLVDRLYSIVFLCVILIDDLVDNVNYVSLPSRVRVVVLLCIVAMYHHFVLCRWIIVFCIVGELEDCLYLKLPIFDVLY
jgi:hypothetical protein